MDEAEQAAWVVREFMQSLKDEILAKARAAAKQPTIKGLPGDQALLVFADFIEKDPLPAPKASLITKDTI